MKPMPSIAWRFVVASVPIVLALLGQPSMGWAAQARVETSEVRVVSIKGTLEIFRAGAAKGVKTTDVSERLYPSDRLRTGTNSLVVIALSKDSKVPLGPLTEIEILPPDQADGQAGLHLFQGVLSFFHRDKPGRIRVITRGTTAGVKGTEFVMEVAGTGDSERTTIWVIDGEVSFATAQGQAHLVNGQQATAEIGQAPVRSSGFIANNVLQWLFHYPAVLDLHDLQLTPGEQQALGKSLEAYRLGDLASALAEYPAGREPGSDSERIYHTALLLSAGRVDQTESALSAWRTGDSTNRFDRLAASLRHLIAAVKRETRPPLPGPRLATEFLAESYHRQSVPVRGVSLEGALLLAKQAAAASPESGFAWARVAELEFSFGHTADALAALNKGLALGPRNAEALALKGFLLAGENRIGEAIDWFDRAIASDPSVGNAWVGRGLCRIRRGDTAAGRDDLLVAAALEPQRGVLRSYLGKAWSDSGDDDRARKELGLARTLDPLDPTGWLYSALNNERNNRINEAILDLEKSQDLNDNRGVYRSGLLLDQDRAVRSANLARIYAEAGLADVGLREASRAVTANYADFSAHRFLADSYAQLRRNNLHDLRHEAAGFSEHLLASLLGPADGRLLAQSVSQQEYTRLFERDSFGLSSSTEYLSRGAWSQQGVQFGTFGNTSYALEAGYDYDPGETPHREREARLLSARFKQLITPDDGLFVEALTYRRENADLTQRYDPNQAVDGVQTKLRQEPVVLVGWDHSWDSGQRTLALASYLDSFQNHYSPHGPTLLLADDGGVFQGMVAVDLTQEYQSRLTLASFEVQHFIPGSRVQTLAGLRAQFGRNQFTSRQTIVSGNAAGQEDYFLLNGSLIADQAFTTESLRISPYLYEYWQVTDSLQLIGGLSFDYQERARNTLFAPVQDGRETDQGLSPHLALLWTPTGRSAVRAAWSRSIGGADLDQSVRLEPTQVAGFAQTFRNLIPNSLAGDIGGARFETADISFEHRFPTATYVALSGQFLRSTSDHDVGVFRSDFQMSLAMPEQTRERLRFEETSVEVSLRQLLGSSFSAGVSYRLSGARLARDYPDIDPALVFGPNGTMSGWLQTLAVQGMFRSSRGFFMGAEAVWRGQELHGTLEGMPGDQFWQVDLQAGYRSPRRRVELTVGVLNLNGRDYRLHPINLAPDLARERTFYTRLGLNF